MKQLKVTVYKNTPVEVLSEIKQVVHGLPTWMFPTNILEWSKNIRCPVCHSEMELTISHGQYIKTCSFIKTATGFMSPIHTACYENIGNDENKVNHYPQSASILDEINT